MTIISILSIVKEVQNVKKIVDEHKKLQIYSVMSIYSKNVLQWHALNIYYMQ